MAKRKAGRPWAWVGLVDVPNPDWPRGELHVTEWPHALLVAGTSDHALAAQALDDEGTVDRSTALMMPRRPFHDAELGSCVAFYFNVMGERVTEKEKAAALKKYKRMAREKAAA